MKRVLLLLGFVLLFAPRGHAQTQIQAFPTAPATCTTTRGLLYWDTSLLLMRFCSSTNTWSSLASGSAPVTGCTTTGGVAFENGTNNTLTCVANFTYSNSTGLIAGSANAGDNATIRTSTPGTGLPFGYIFATNSIRKADIYVDANTSSVIFGQQSGTPTVTILANGAGGNPLAGTGHIRMSKLGSINWRNNANTTDWGWALATNDNIKTNTYLFAGPDTSTLTSLLQGYFFGSTTGHTLNAKVNDALYNIGVGTRVEIDGTISGTGVYDAIHVPVADTMAAYVGRETDLQVEAPMGTTSAFTHYALFGSVNSLGAGNQASLVAVTGQAVSNGSGTVTNLYGGLFGAPASFMGGTVHNTFGVAVGDQANVGDTFNAGFYAPGQTAGVHNWGFYSDVTNIDHFGKVTESTTTIPEGSAPAASASNDICYGDSTAHALKCSYNNGSFLNVPQTVCSGTISLPTSAVASGGKFGASSSTPQQTTCTGMLTSDNVMLTFNADPTSTTGYTPSASGMLTIVAYPDGGGGKIDLYLINNTNASITPGAATVNYRVIR